MGNDPNVEYIEMDHKVGIEKKSQAQQQDVKESAEQEPSVQQNPGGINKLDYLDWGMLRVLQDYTFWDQLPTPDAEMKVCVVDSGYNLGHSDLPFSSADVTGFDTPGIDEKWSFDGNGHGTHVAGTIAALGGNGIGVRGIIPNNKGGKFKLMIGKAFDSSGEGFVSDSLYAVEQCFRNGARVINLSLGGPNYSSGADQLYQQLYDNGVLIVAAAGNKGDSSYSYPASYSSTMSVAAVAIDSNWASFSQFNDWVEISGPGVDIWSTDKFNTYRLRQGTSMASPHVAAVAALAWMYYPECSNERIRLILRYSNEKIDGVNWNPFTGFGLVQAINALALLNEVGCGNGNVAMQAKGGYEQFDTYSASCNVDSDCDDGDLCTVDSCSADGTCTTSMDCAQCQKDALMNINIVTDTYPSETTWDITVGSTTYASGGPYAGMMKYSNYVCLPAGSYKFTIYDKFGDGLCCAGGNGSYDLSLDDTVLKVGGSFARGESTSFDVMKAS